MKESLPSSLTQFATNCGKCFYDPAHLSESGSFSIQEKNIQNTNPVMPRILYSPKLSDDVIRALYREGQRRRMPMTRLADELLRRSLGGEFSGMAGPPLINPDQVIIHMKDAA
jgi:hypothetical protein